MRTWVRKNPPWPGYTVWIAEIDERTYLFCNDQGRIEVLDDEHWPEYAATHAELWELLS